MSYADKVFKETVRDILENGTDTQGELVRPHWADGTPAYTIKKFGVVNRYDLRKEFPALTLRRIGLKSAMDEILWIWQKKSNNIHDLNSHIWDQWADEIGSIKKAYGYQAGREYRYKEINRAGLEKAFPGIKYQYGLFDNMYAICNDRFVASDDGSVWRMDQMDKVIYDLINTPFSRRIIATT